ncbi:hypothetical protein SpCBS45565_g05691 [Spizellomyces sp. 'palustris']|nr:hypothetical protein SpCBS45565_g05691 [Spizellomyces sp. 'palustris']
MNALSSFRVALLRTSPVRGICTPQIRCMSQGLGAHMNDNDPKKIQRDAPKAKPGKKDTSSHFNQDGGWAEEMASTSEAAVKADRGHHHKHDDLKSLQDQSVEKLTKKHRGSA